LIFDNGVDIAYFGSMIRDAEYLESQKRAWLSQHQLSLEEKYRILDAMYSEARDLGHFNRADLLSGLEDDVHLAALLNANVSNPPR
jgi:hypothetical protein